MEVWGIGGVGVYSEILAKDGGNPWDKSKTLAEIDLARVAAIGAKRHEGRQLVTFGRCMVNVVPWGDTHCACDHVECTVGHMAHMGYMSCTHGNAVAYAWNTWYTCHACVTHVAHMLYICGTRGKPVVCM